MEFRRSYSASVKIERNSAFVPPPLPWSAEYNAIYSEFSSKPSDADADAQNVFVQTGVTDGWWSQLDRLFIWAGHDGAVGNDTLLDWIHPSVAGNIATLVNNPVWTKYQGYQGDGATQYIKLNFTPSVDAVKNTTISATMGFYCRTIDATNSDFDLGSETNGSSQMGTHWTFPNFNGNINSSSTISFNIGTSQGLFAMDMDFGVEAQSAHGYKNGVYQSKANRDNKICAGEYYALAREAFSSPFNLTIRQQSMAFAGGHLGGAGQLSLYNAFQTLMTHYGTQV